MALKVDLGTLKQGVSAPNAYLRIEEMQAKALAGVESDLEVEVVVAVYVNRAIRNSGGEAIERRSFRFVLDEGNEPLRKRVYTALKAEFAGAQDE